MAILKQGKSPRPPYDMEESIILYCQRQLGLKSWSDLRAPENMERFLALILSDDLMRTFSAGQYRYAANLVNGRRRHFKDDESVYAFLRSALKAVGKFNLMQKAQKGQR